MYVLTKLYFHIAFPTTSPMVSAASIGMSRIELICTPEMVRLAGTACIGRAGVTCLRPFAVELRELDRSVIKPPQDYGELDAISDVLRIRGALGGVIENCLSIEYYFNSPIYLIFLQPGLAQNELLDCLLGDPPDAAVPVALELTAAQQRVQCVVSDPQRFSGLFGGQDIGVFLEHLLALLADAVTLTVGTGARIDRAGAA